MQQPLTTTHTTKMSSLSRGSVTVKKVSQGGFILISLLFIISTEQTKKWFVTIATMGMVYQLHVMSILTEGKKDFMKLHS